MNNQPEPKPVVSISLSGETKKEVWLNLMALLNEAHACHEKYEEWPEYVSISNKGAISLLGHIKAEKY